MSSKNQALQDAVSVDNFLNVAATETIPLFEYLSFEFLLGYDVFASSERCGQGLWPRARPCPRPRPRTNGGVSLTLPPSYRRNHQLRTRRQPGTWDAQGM